MKLHFLGTGAADWDRNNPQVGKNYRRLSSLLIDDQLLIDPGPCIFEFAESYQYPHLFEKLRTVLNTHTHSDHFDPESVARLSLPIIHIPDYDTLETEQYRITAYPANHETAKNPQHFVIESLADNRKIFYGCDV
jgi:glyoxylase-like metal-dependent hydrolase (beta-lactamase superfamily II)